MRQVQRLMSARGPVVGLQRVDRIQSELCRPACIAFNPGARDQIPLCRVIGCEADRVAVGLGAGRRQTGTGLRRNSIPSSAARASGSASVIRSSGGGVVLSMNFSSQSGVGWVRVGPRWQPGPFAFSTPRCGRRPRVPSRDVIPAAAESRALTSESVLRPSAGIARVCDRRSAVFSDERVAR